MRKHLSTLCLCGLFASPACAINKGVVLSDKTPTPQTELADASLVHQPAFLRIGDSVLQLTADQPVSLLLADPILEIEIGANSYELDTSVISKGGVVDCDDQPSCSAVIVSVGTDGFVAVTLMGTSIPQGGGCTGAVGCSSNGGLSCFVDGKDGPGICKCGNNNQGTDWSTCEDNGAYIECRKDSSGGACVSTPKKKKNSATLTNSVPLAR